MANLEPVFSTVLAGITGIVGTVIFNYFKFFRHNKVEDRKTESERLEAENERANKRADAAEADADAAKIEADKWYSALMVKQGDYLHEREYVSVLRKRIMDLGHEPPDPPTRLKGR